MFTLQQSWFHLKILSLAAPREALVQRLTLCPRHAAPKFGTLAFAFNHILPVFPEAHEWNFQVALAIAPTHYLIPPLSSYLMAKLVPHSSWPRMLIVAPCTDVRSNTKPNFSAWWLLPFLISMLRALCALWVPWYVLREQLK